MLQAPLEVTPQLKRTYSASTGSVRSYDDLPQLPRITGTIILEVFTHKSLRQPDFEDNEKLSDLGSKAVEMSVVFNLFRRHPLLTADEISVQKEAILSPLNYEYWVSGYKLRQKLRCMPEVLPTLTMPQETRALFHAYMGAVYLESGINAVQQWVDQQMDPGSTRPTTPPAKKAKADIFRPVETPPIFLPPQPPVVFPTPPNPFTPAQPGLAFLPLFNQTAMQRRVTVDYPASFTGPSHAGRWTVECKVNGLVKGIGTGASKQIAKEEAARQAFYAMGWRGSVT